MNNAMATSQRLWLLPLELAAFALVFVGDGAGWIPLSKTPFLFLIGWVSLRLRGLRWKDLGFWLASNWRSHVLIGIAAGVAFWLLEYFVENPLLYAIAGRYPDLSDFKDVVGNLQLLAILLVANIVLAGFGEEMVWRGYALSRVAEVIGTRWSWALSIVLVNAAFGLAHSYQGESGAIQAAVQGVLLGILYLRTGRNLVAPICAHIIANTCDFIMIYAGLHVGVTGVFPF
jgi:uncharacterized protein